VKVAIAHEWIVTLGGSERVALEFHQLYPDAPIFTTVYDARARTEFRGADVRPSFLQRIPGATRRYPQLLPLMPLAFSRFDTRGYDLVLISSHAASKAIRKQPGQVHVCYCHTPMRYAWDLYDLYVTQSGLNPAQRVAARVIFRAMRRWDRRSAAHIDVFIANSENVRRRIERYYGRDAVVIPPPIDCERFQVSPTVSDYFLVVSRLVPYKRVDIAIQAFNDLGWPLHVVGAGAELGRLRAMAGPTIRFFGQLDDAELAREYASARALVFTANEDAGMVPLEAMASGRPVLAYRGGGAVEVVQANVTGAFFDAQEPAGLIEALRRFNPDAYDPAVIRAHAERYDRPRFRTAIAGVVTRAGRSVTGLPTPG